MQFNSKRLTTKWLALLLCVLLVGNLGISWAATDVSTSHWANAQVERVTAKNIMPLNADGSFKPDSVVTNLEVIVAIYRAAKESGHLKNVEIGTLTTKHEVSLKALGIPQMLAPYGSDVYPALAYALENGILTLDEVKVFVSGITMTNVKKVNAVVFIAKALNVYKKADLNKVTLLTFKDISEIPLSAVKYVNLLIEEGIVSSKGDSYGKFNPTATVNRATLAAMIDGLYKGLEGLAAPGVEPTTEPVTEPSTEPTTEQPVIIETEKIVTGTVKTVNDGNSSVELVTQTGKTEIYSLIDVSIKIGDKKVGFESITLGAAIELTIEKGIVTKATLNKAYSRVEGAFVQLKDVVGSSTKKSMKLTLDDKSSVFKTVYPETLVTINGAPAKLTDLKVGHRIIALFENNDVKRIMAFTETYDFYAINQLVIDPVKMGQYEVQLESGVILSGTLDKTVYTINAPNGLKVNDVVRVTMKKGKIAVLEYVGQAKTVVGKISGINITKTPELTIVNASNKEETFAFSTKIKMLDESGDNSISVYDFRLDQEVTVQVGIGGIKQIQLGRKIVVEPTGIKVTVTQVIDSSNIMLAVDENNRIRTITFPVGSTFKASDYKAGMVVFIEGKAITDTVFEVVKVTVQSN